MGERESKKEWERERIGEIVIFLIEVASEVKIMFLPPTTTTKKKEEIEMPITSQKIKLEKVFALTSSSKLFGFVCAYHPAARGSNPKHTIYAFFNLY